MPAIKIKENIYSVGVLNPNMRIFDVIMKTEYGTSYNAYLVKGEKTALIETVHPRFFEEYLENISSVVNPAEIDYVIMNHNEPDHSGSLARLLTVAPQIQVITSQAGGLYIKHITNKQNFELTTVKDGETLDLGGGKVLRFVNAPFLHWPDSMFTWLEEDKIAFTCDFLGSHYCEPRMLDSHVTYPQRYKEAFRGYYDAIFGPFKPYVLKGLEKLNALDADLVCTSHGPILQKGVFLETAKQDYAEWSTVTPRDHKLIPIFYCSAYGNTEALANRIADGIKAAIPSAQLELYDLNSHYCVDLEEKLNGADAFLLGSPTLNKDAVRPIWLLAASIDAINAKGKPCAVFGSYGWSGEAIPMLTERLKSLKLSVFEDGYKCRFVPSDEELEGAFEFGKRFAQSLS
jgi:NADH oxidase (H2O-forming)